MVNKRKGKSNAQRPISSQQSTQIPSSQPLNTPSNDPPPAASSPLSTPQSSRLGRAPPPSGGIQTPTPTRSDLRAPFHDEYPPIRVTPPQYRVTPDVHGLSLGPGTSNHTLSSDYSRGTVMSQIVSTLILTLIGYGLVSTLTSVRIHVYSILTIQENVDARTLTMRISVSQKLNWITGVAGR